MASEKEAFFALSSFAVVGDSNIAPFPKEVYLELSRRSQRTFAVDLGGSRYVGGDEAFGELRLLPQRVEGVVVALPRHRLAPVVEAMARMKIGHLFVAGVLPHDQLVLCQRAGINAVSGNPRLYTSEGFGFGRLLAKLLGQY